MSTGYDAEPMHLGSPSGLQSITRTRSVNSRPPRSLAVPSALASAIGVLASIWIPDPVLAVGTGDPNPPASPPPPASIPLFAASSGSGNASRTLQSGFRVFSRVAVYRVTPAYVTSRYGLDVLESLFVAGRRAAPATSTMSDPDGPASAPLVAERYARSTSW